MCMWVQYTGKIVDSLPVFTLSIVSEEAGLVYTKCTYVHTYVSHICTYTHTSWYRYIVHIYRTYIYVYAQIDTYIH